jgi:hypothetical protein
MKRAKIALVLDDVRGCHGARDDVVEQDVLQESGVRRETVKCRLGHLRERSVRRGEDRERTAVREGVGEAGLRHERDERVELAGRDAFVGGARRVGSCPCNAWARESRAG